ncbi:hypothetical protein RUM43_004760 [Polyplax serrata]|uniref:Uncharacterized protein n=1 Tax=Polyplax serrata TaxID=468196 RepID=A0AAN8XMF6_POLSC
MEHYQSRPIDRPVQVRVKAEEEEEENKVGNNNESGHPLRRWNSFPFRLTQKEETVEPETCDSFPTVPGQVRDVFPVEGARRETGDK